MSPVVMFRSKLCCVVGAPNVLEEQPKVPEVETVGIHVTFPKLLVKPPVAVGS